MSVRKFPPKLIQHLLVRIVKNENPNELCFRLGGEIFTFGLCDFCLITGLDCSPLKNVDLDRLPESELIETIFEGDEQVNWYDLHDEFKGCDFKDEELSLKISKLFLVESMVVAKQYQTNIEKMHFRLVEDDDAFNSYPWGRLSFDLLCASIKKILKFQNTGFHRLSGFPQALVIWACEILPALSLNSSYTRRINSEYPRILNWDYHKQGTWRNYQTDIFKEPMNVKIIKPTAEELGTKYLAPFVNEFRERENVASGQRTSKRKRHLTEDDEYDVVGKKMEEDIQLIISQNYMLKMSVQNLTKKVEDLQEMFMKHMSMGGSDKMEIDKNLMNVEVDEEEAPITNLGRDNDDEEMTHLTRARKETEKGAGNVETGQGDKSKKKEVVIDKNENKNSEGVESNVMINTKRLRKTGSKLLAPYTDKFGSNEKEMKGPSFHILTPATQNE